MKKCKLGELLTIKHGYAFKSKNYVNKSNFALVTLANISESNDFQYNDRKTTFYGEDFPKEYILKTGDLIMPLTEQVVGLIGNSALVPKIDNITFVLNQRVGKVIFDEKKVNKYFLRYLLSTKNVKEQLEYRASGTKQRNISPENVYDVMVYIPELEIQEKIGTILYSIERKINNNNRIIFEIEQMVKTIYDYWFLQYEFPNDEGKPYKSSGGKMIWNEELKKEIPESWKITTIGEIMIERKKSSIKVGQAKNKLGNYPFFTSGSEIYEMNEFLTDGRNCFLSTGGKGYVQYYVGKSSYSTDTWVISGIKDLEDYLYLFIKSIENILDNKYFAGTGLQHLQKDLFKDTHIVIPSDEILKKFNKISNTIFNKISRIHKENKELQKLRDFLLPLLMNEQVGFKS